jgi:hypothetical protein
MTNRKATMQRIVILIAAVISMFPIVSSRAVAGSDGMTGRSTQGCGGCHGNNATAALNVTVNQPQGGILAGQQVDLSVVIGQAAGAASAGLNLAIRNDLQNNIGQIAAGVGTKVVGGELTHQQPKPFAGGQVDFPFTWTAPAAHGTYTLTVSGNAVNNNGRADGNDQWKIANAVTLTVKGASITAPTGGQELCPGQTLGITWTQTGLAQVRVEASPNNGTTWTAIAPTVTASAGAYNWTIPGDQQASTQYIVRLVDAASGQEVTRSGVFTILPGPTIVQQPEDVRECIGGTFTLSIGIAQADAQLRWRKNGEIIPGAVNPTLTIVNAKQSDAGSYDVQVFGCGQSLSRTATVTILQRPAITRQPTAASACQDQPVFIEVQATGDSLTYQWYKSGEAIPAQTSAKLSFAQASIFDDASYYCIVTGGCTPVLTTDTVQITVLESPRITGEPSDKALSEGEALVLSVQATGKQLRYHWMKDGKSITGATEATYRINAVVRADSGRYMCSVKNACDSAVTKVASVTVQPASGPGILVLDQPQVTFGTIAVCERPTETFSGLLRNRGGSPVTITTISVDPPSLLSVVDVDLPLVIPAGESRDLRLRCNPKAQGDLSATVAFFVAGVRTELQVKAVVTPGTTVDADTLFFVPGVDQQPARCNVLDTVQCDQITITAVRISGAGASSYRFVALPALPVTVAKGQSMNVCLEAVGPTGGTATVTIESSAGDEQFLVVRDVLASVDDADVSEMFSIAPNPTTGAISITAPNGTHTLMVLDVQGAVVFQQALDASSMVWDGRSMHGAMVAPGIYTVVFEGASRTTSASLVVIR